MTRLFRSIRRLSPSLAVSAAALLSIGVTGASASSNIEGVWSFNGGAVDVVAQPNGTFTGVVSVQTKFAQCFHMVNEDMWTEIRQQPDGSYWGFHKWYFEPSAEAPSCTLNPTLGPTAWRVLDNSKGEAFLRVCFSSPEGGTQPTIAPDGSSANVSYGCVDSVAITSIPVVSAKEGAATPKTGEISFEQSVGLPSAKQCVRRSAKLTIKLHEPKYDPFKEVVVRIKGKKVLDIRGTKKLKKAIVLKHLPTKGSYTVRVVAITVLDQHVSGSRTYHSCTKGSGKIKLHHSKKHKK